jgi:hypothetical protein
MSRMSELAHDVERARALSGADCAAELRKVHGMLEDAERDLAK